MQKFHILRFAALLGTAAIVQSAAAYAQQGPNWFVPGQPHAAPAPAAPRPPAPRPAPTRPALQPIAPEPVPADQASEPPPVQVQLPPVPELPPLPKGSTPPAAVIGVLGVPEVMRASVAAQAVEKVIGERREKLNQDAQKEQAAWRDLQQALATQRANLSADQIRTKERELQERITNAQRQFRDRNRIIQAAAQVALGQIERTLIAVIRQVAESRGMNLVLHRAQVALNVNEFDITEQVAEQINKILPSVVIPPDGQEPTAANMGLTNSQTAAVPPSATQASAPQAAPSAPPPRKP